MARTWRETKMRTGVEVFGIIGMSMGTMGFIFGINAMNSVAALKKQLKEAGVLTEEPKSE